MDSRDLNLMVGAGLQLEKQGSDERYLVELLGYSVGKGVIISAPQASDERMVLAPGMRSPCVTWAAAASRVLYHG